MSEDYKFVEPKAFFAIDGNLELMCNFIEENYTLPHEAFSHFNLCSRAYYALEKLVYTRCATEKTAYIYYRLNAAVDKWMAATRKKILDSKDEKAKATLLKFLHSGKMQKKDISQKIHQLIDFQNYIDERMKSRPEYDYGQ